MDKRIVPGLPLRKLPNCIKAGRCISETLNVVKRYERTKLPQSRKWWSNNSREDVRN